ncbi:putative conidiation-specific protein [Rosellinia necatrix]|uniref:Putative conidiation-specific protein n=1 Tax=Rosellinia necatrix TaxID=77044 RepID=A0A1W2TU86_ROSNE|nr:putative conidiation-specific protein [Rosellinia necatrix]
MRYSLLYTASAVSMVTATLDKPVISPPFPNGGLDSLASGLNSHLATPGRTYNKWNNGYIPKDCKSIAESAGFSAADVDTLDIKYDDCSTNWQMCRHHDSPLSEQDIVDTFGKLPVHFRSFVRHMVFLPGAESAGSNGDNVQMNGNLPITVYIHETGHSVDSHGFPDIGQFSVSQVWLDAYNADSAVPDGYAQSSQQENFAQATVCAIYAQVVPEGLGPIEPNYQAISHQYGAIQSHGQDIIVPGGQCTHRLDNSEPVAQNRSAKLRPIGAKPDVSRSAGIKALKTIPMKDTMEIKALDGSVIATQKMIM